jgi:hypothetical protein
VLLVSESNESCEYFSREDREDAEFISLMNLIFGFCTIYLPENIPAALLAFDGSPPSF